MNVLFEILVTALFSFLMSPEPIQEDNSSTKEEIKQVQQVLQKECPSPEKEEKTKGLPNIWQPFLFPVKVVKQ